eukprot:104782-Rhodomonas_salina.1
MLCCSGGRSHVALLPVASAEFGAGVAAACSPLARFASCSAPRASVPDIATKRSESTCKNAHA